jgi:hypothetical protein
MFWIALPRYLFIFLAIVFTSQQAFAQQSIHYRALNATLFYERTLETLLQQCLKIDSNKQSAVEMRICRNYRLVPAIVIERAALPFFVDTVSEFEAQQIAHIFGTEPWITLVRRLLERDRRYEPIPLSQQEEAEVARFRSTPVGVKLLRFEINPLLQTVVMNAILQYGRE